MNNKLTFTPNLMERIKMLMARAETELRYGFNIYSNHHLDTLTNNLQRVTTSLLKEVCTYWERSKVDPDIAYNDPQREITCTSTFTPAMVWLHARLCLERDHYARLEKRETDRSLKQIERQTRWINRMLPSWELRRMASITRENGRNKHTLTFSNIRDNRAFNYIPDGVFRISMATLMMIILISLSLYLINNLDGMLVFVAEKISSSGLTFQQALIGLGIAIYAGLSVILLSFLELFHQPSNKEILDFVDASYADTQEQLADLNYTLNEEVLTRIIP